MWTKLLNVMFKMEAMAGNIVKKLFLILQNFSFNFLGGITFVVIH